MRRARQESSTAPAIPSPKQATPPVAHAGQSGSREDTPQHADIYPRRKSGPHGRGNLTREEAARQKPYERNIVDPDAKKYRVRGRYKVREKRELGQEPPTIRYEIPSVAKHVARIVVMYHMDYVKAVRYLLGADADGINVSKLADRLEQNKQVQKFVEEELTVHGLDEMSKDAFVREMWDWLRRGTENKSMKAAGILGKGFIAEKVEAVKPEELPIEGLDDAVRSMLGESRTPSAGRDPHANKPTDDIQIAEQSPSDARGPILDSTRPPDSAN